MTNEQRANQFDLAIHVVPILYMYFGILVFMLAGCASSPDEMPDSPTVYRGGTTVYIASSSDATSDGRVNRPRPDSLTGKCSNEVKRYNSQTDRCNAYRESCRAPTHLLHFTECALLRSCEDTLDKDRVAMKSCLDGE